MSNTINSGILDTGDTGEVVILPFEKVTGTRLELAVNRYIKRSVDILLGGLLSLLILPWLIPLVAIIIKLDSKGPVFFIQKRTGLNRKTFYCFKFRTMVVNDDADRLQVQVGDKRITKSGYFLRKYYLDEVPQLLNVLWGNMSLVGPRPHMLRHNVVYARQIKNYHDRHRVKPGLSGLAQLRGYHGMIKDDQDLVNRISSDIEYIRNWSLFKDLCIFFSTIVHVLTKSND
jgi:putative colanic acid biosynthesis UDP-glucose lipid carrier transferase